MNLYNRQQTAYLLPLPIDVIDIILSFVFYDKTTGEARKLHHTHMCQIVFRFANAMDSRAIGKYNWEDPDTDEHWHISLNIPDQFTEEVQLQAVNCGFCGEYQLISTNIQNIPLPCRCIQIDDDNEELP